MPYIKQDQRDVVDRPIGELMDAVYEVEQANPGSIDGVLNYTVSTIVANALRTRNGNWSYKDIARAVAVFECAKLEFYRRVAAPKEDAVIKLNGDIDSYIECV